MLHTHEIDVVDNGINKQFRISKLPALVMLNYIATITNLIVTTDEINKNLVKQIAHNILGTGVQLVHNDAIIPLLNQDIRSLLLDIVINLISTLDDAKKINKIIQPLIARTLVVDGNILLTTDESSDGFIDNHISDFSILIKIISEGLSFNFGRYFRK